MSDAAFPDAADVVESALRASSADDCVVLVEETSNVDVRFAVNTVTTNGYRRSRSVTVVSLVGAGSGVAAGLVTRAGAVDAADLAAESERLARSAPPAPDAAPITRGAAEADFDSPAAETDPSVLSSIVSSLRGAFDAAESDGIRLAGFAEHSFVTTYLGTSGGLRRRFVQPTGQFQLNGRADGGRRSSWASTASPDLVDVDVDAAVLEVRRRLGWAERFVELPAGRYEVVMPPICVADLLLYFYFSLSGREAEDGRTVFSKKGGGTRVGERICELPFELRSDPREPGLFCTPFHATRLSSANQSVFDNGIDLGATSWVKDGVLENLFYSRAGAERCGARPAAPIDNLVLELPGATKTVDELVAGTERGLLLTSLWYIREVDPATLLLTGLTRDGVYLVEDGRITGATNNFRFNESPVDLLANAVEAGALTRTLSREWGDEMNRTKMSPLRVREFNMSSVSPAN
jgi:predicted Zn-dependent protease